MVSHTEVVRDFYRQLNAKDFEAASRYLHTDVERSDPIRPGSLIKGRGASLLAWVERFSEMGVSALVGDLVDLADVVVAAVRYQIYDPNGSPAGSPLVIVHRFHFLGDEVLRIDTSVLDDLPDDVKTLLFRGAVG